MSAFKKIKTASGQILSDIAIQEYGKYEGVFTLREDNSNVVSVDQVFTPGTELNIRINEGNIESNQFQLEGKTINSGFVPSELEDESYYDFGYYNEGYI